MTRTSKKIRVPDLAVMKERGERIVMLTAYDATMARLLDRAGIDLLLVGDSLGNVILGLDTTIPVSLDAVLHHTRAVARGQLPAGTSPDDLMKHLTAPLFHRLLVTAEPLTQASADQAAAAALVAARAGVFVPAGDG